jgi:hypothetical protein
MKKFAFVAVSSATLITSLALAAPAQAAPPTVTITYAAPGLTKGDALTTGAQLELLGPVPDSVNVQGRLGVEYTVNYGGVNPFDYAAQWYRCPSRTSVLADCLETASNEGGGAPRSTYVYAPGPLDLGSYIRFVMRVRNANGESSVTEGTGARQPLVWPKLATGSPATFAAAPVPGTQSNIALKAWTLPEGTTFASRAVTVWSCPSASNGQVSTYAWNARGDGCTDVSSGITSTFNTAAATTIAFNVPAGTEGRYLVVSDQVLARFSASTTGALVRSSGNLIGGATPSASPSPTPTPSPSATPTAAPTAAPAAKFRIAVITKSSVTRGARLKVVVSTSTATSIGTAKVQLKKRPTAKGGAAQTLKSIDVVNGTGQSVTKVGKRLAKGNYYVFATYVDDRSGKVTTASAPITLK